MFLFSIFLRSITNHKCKIAINETILEKYNEFVKKCPIEIKSVYGNIISQTECVEIIKDGLDLRKKTPFLKTLLEHKIPYIAVACVLKSKTIVSTKKEIAERYTLCYEKLCLIQVNYKDVCTVNKELS